LPLAEAGTPRAAIARLRVPAGAVGLLLINKEQAGMDTPLRDGDVLDVLPLLGGGAQR
jgi:molybdopterin converting factor small subunit